MCLSYFWSTICNSHMLLFWSPSKIELNKRLDVHKIKINYCNPHQKFDVVMIVYQDVLNWNVCMEGLIFWSTPASSYKFVYYVGKWILSTSRPSDFDSFRQFRKGINGSRVEILSSVEFLRENGQLILVFLRRQ